MPGANASASLEILVTINITRINMQSNKSLEVLWKNPQESERSQLCKHCNDILLVSVVDDHAC